MNNVIIITVIVVVFIGLGIFVGNSKASHKSEVTYATIKTDITNGAKLYDVRTAEEYRSGHIVEAVNLPLQAIQQNKLPQVDKSEKIYVYCRSGNRSAQAAKLLASAGYTNIENLGGINAVQKIGGEVTKQ